MKQTISAKKIVNDHGLSPQSIVKLVRSGEISIYDKFNRIIDIKAHQNKFEELVFNYTTIDLTRSDEDSWDKYIDAFAFNDESVAKSTQMAYEHEQKENALLEIEYELIINNYYFDTEINTILAKMTEDNKNTAGIPPTEKIQHTEINRDMALAMWQHAVNTYESTRDNDALPKRMNILLQRLRGTSYSELENSNDGTNISNALNTARTKDVPALLKINPVLPWLDFKKYT